MRIYLASRYSRREELRDYRRRLQEAGFDVQARWLNGEHQMDNADTIEAFANDDWEDVNAAECVVNFTEPPRSGANRGGRHVEFGIALARGVRVVVVGHRENIFHWLPEAFLAIRKRAILDSVFTEIQ